MPSAEPKFTKLVQSAQNPCETGNDAETGGFVEGAAAGRVRQHPDGSSGCHLELARLDIEERREADCCQRNCIGPSRQGEVLGGDNRNSATALYPCLGLRA